MIPIGAMNCDKEIWGADAGEFMWVSSSSLPAQLKLIFGVEMSCSPERWEAKIPISNSLPGVWGHMLTFLGGPRACIVRPSAI
jgi:hypothetical protein